MFACFGLRSRQKRLDPMLSAMDIPTEEYMTPFTRGPSIRADAVALKSFKRSRSGNLDIPQGTPLWKRASLKKKKRDVSDFYWMESKEPVKILRPSVTNGQVPGQSQAAEKIKKLETELSLKSSESLKARSDADTASRRVEALTVLVHYLTTECEAFATAKLKSEIKQITSQLTDVRLRLDETSAASRRLDDQLADERRGRAQELAQKDRNHKLEVTTLVKDYEEKLISLVQKHRFEIGELTEKENSKIEEIKSFHHSEIQKISTECDAKLEEQQKVHVTSLRNSSDHCVKQVKEAESLWVNREEELLELNRQLMKQNTILRQEAKELEQTLLSDKDHRLQAVKKLCTALQNEVESLKTVLEMRNSEIHKLRNEIVDKERLTEELEVAREKVRALNAKSEDLQAQMNTKNQLERQLLAEHDSLNESLQKETAANKRLSLENEELQWKLRQREAVCGSLPTSTLDLVSRCTAPSVSRQHEPAQKGGDKSLSPVSPRPQRIGCRRYEKWSQSFTHIPEHSRSSSLSKDSRFLWGDELPLESPPLSPRVKGVIEKSNSVSFILDLNDAISEEPPFLEQASPRHATKQRTPISQRKSPRNEKICKKKTSSLIGTKSSPIDISKKTPSVNDDVVKVEKSTGEIDADSCPVTNKKVKVNLSRSDTFTKHRSEIITPESSDGGDVERISPSGLAWSVPVQDNAKNGRKHIPKFHLTSEMLKHLQGEDEYEENENEFVEVVTISEELSSASLKTIFNQTPSTSISLSDSEVSQCGSGADLSFDEEEDCCSDFEATADSRKRTSVMPVEGAGEAMVYPDNLSVNGQKEDLGFQSQISSDSEEVAQNGQEDRASSMSWSEDPEFDLTSSSDMQDVP